MKRTVFYSWQSDLPNSCNRGFIQQALENAAAAIVADDTVAIEPVVDRDTQGVPGSPEIASTIFAKITAADVFVADISIVSRPAEGRPAPNPNVLIELGYALKALGHERIILIFNRVFGKIEELPFDLRMRRVLLYEMPAESKERAPERKTLERRLHDAIRTALDNLPSTDVGTLPIPAIAAIENNQPNRIVLLRRKLDELFTTVVKLQPKTPSAGGTVDELIAGIGSTQEVVAEFSKIAETVALMDDVDSALEIYRWHGRIFEKYSLPENFSGRYSVADFDYFKFLGHELLVSVFAFLIRERRWKVMERLIVEPIPVRYLHREHGPGNAYWEYASQHLPSLLDESHRRHRLSLHADLLHERHTRGGLAGVSPFEDFASADYFLFLLGELPPEEAPDYAMKWRPWSALYLKRAPLFLVSAEQKSVADESSKVLGLPNVGEFKKRLAERSSRVELLFREGWWDHPLTSRDIERIGSR